MQSSNQHPLKLGLASLVAGLGFSMAGNAAAQAITGTVDGEEMEWHIVEGEKNPSGTFSAIGLEGNVYMSNIVGHQDEGHTAEDVSLPSEGTLQLRFTRTDDNESVGPPHIDFYDTGDMYPSYTNDDDGDLQIDSISENDGELSVSGSYTGTLQRVQEVAGAGDPNDAVEVDVEFEATLAERED